MIRAATTADAPRILEMGRRFLLNGPYRDQLEDNPEQAARLLMQLFENSSAKILVAEREDGRVVGMFAFIIFSHHLSGEITAGELEWYVEPEDRSGGVGLKLLKAAEALARELGAKRMQLTAPTAKLGELYKRCGGYEQVEVMFQRRL